MDIKSVLDFLGNDWTSVGAEMKAALGTDVALLRQTNEQIFENAGKMLRPVLSLLVARSIGSTNEDTVRVAATAQMIHNSTLLHDDVVDDSPMRRGKPTVKSILGGTASVLIGDFWLVRSLDLILKVTHERDRLMKLFSTTLSNLAEGEIIQLEKSTKCDTSMDDYLKIIYCKTASLFEVSTLSAAISIGAPAGKQDCAAEFGRMLGLAFQIKDDIMDYDSGGEIGKPVGIDIKEKKITLPLLGAMKNAGESEEKRMRECISKVDSIEGNCLMVREFVLKNGGIEYAKTVLDEYIDRALVALRGFAHGKAGQILEKMAYYIGDREI